MRLIDADAFKIYIQNALEETRNCYLDGGEWATTITEEFCKDIDEQPTIEERKTGHWKQISPAGIYECDLCGKNIMTKDIDVYDFCHGCGAKMEMEIET